MAQDSLAWIPPQNLAGAVGKIFTSLSSWMAGVAANGNTQLPFFPNGILLGNGTPPTFSFTTGAQTAPAPSFTALGTLTSASPVIQSGRTSVTFAAGAGTLTYPVAFPTACDALLLGSNDLGQVYNTNGAPGASSAAIKGETVAGGALGAAFTVNWLAVGH